MSQSVSCWINHLKVPISISVTLSITASTKLVLCSPPGHDLIVGQGWLWPRLGTSFPTEGTTNNIFNISRYPIYSLPLLNCICKKVYTIVGNEGRPQFDDFKDFQDFGLIAVVGKQDPEVATSVALWLRHWTHVHEGLDTNLHWADGVIKNWIVPLSK